jgi:hypothetical protein
MTNCIQSRQLIIDLGTLRLGIAVLERRSDRHRGTALSNELL